MRIFGVFPVKLLTLIGLVVAAPLWAKEYFIDSQQAYWDISKGLQPGDVI